MLSNIIIFLSGTAFGILIATAFFKYRKKQQLRAGNAWARANGYDEW